MKKRGQVTILIILAIVIIVAVAAYLSLSNQTSTNNINNALTSLGVSQQVNILENFITECLETTLEDAVAVIGIQGGYYNQPEKSEDIGFAFIPYYYDRGSFLQPSLNKIESEISSFMNDALPFCIEDLNIENIALDQGKVITKTEITQNEVTIHSDLEIKVSKGDSTASIELTNYETSLRSKLYDMHELSKYITDSHKEDAEFICISCVADIAEEKGLFLDMVDFGIPFTTIVIISDNSNSTEPQILEFLNRYPETNPPLIS
jgi:hypothetical protein